MVHEFVENVIQKRREQLVTNEEKLEEVDDDTFKKKKKALMDVLLHATIDNQPLTDKEIRDEVHTFMFAVISLNELKYIKVNLYLSS